VVYNEAMINTNPRTGTVRMIRFSAILLICYLAALAAISQIFHQPRPPDLPPNAPSNANYLYYVLYGAIALICLGLAYWTWIQERLKRTFTPLIVAIITLLPVMVNQLTGRFSPLGSRFGSAEGSVLAMFPFLFIGLLLVAWQYKWPYIILVTAGITALNIGMTLTFTSPGGLPFQGVIVVILIQAVVFLAVGGSISFLMTRIRQQQKSLEEANMRLAHHASTLEQLATSRERNRLALELHDTLAHTLSGLSVQLETVKAYWDVDRKTSQSLLEQALKATHLGLEETRRTLKALRAGPLDDLGLIPALRKMAEDTAVRYSLTLEMPQTGPLPALAPDVEQCIYRIAQEAISNAVKHANARKLTVKLEPSEENVQLTIQDDGAGFDVVKGIENGHFGLEGMQERAKLAGGTLEVKSQPGEGTTVRLVI
jgi:signal transduction histidine kinase